LLVTGQSIRAILDKHAQCPKLEGRFAVLFNNVEMWEVDTPTHLADLLDDGVDSLREGIFEGTQGCLHKVQSVSTIINYDF